MHTFQLQTLILTHFKGISHLRLQLDGQNAKIYGQNSTGKTTVADAFHWLLFGKDSANKKDFGIKTVGSEGNVQHNLNHEVEAVLSVDGQPFTLKKVFSEKWAKKRGQPTAQFTGHTTDHFVDGVPVSEKEYAARVAEIADEPIFRLLTSPTYFNEQLHWQDRRQMLLRVVGDLDDATVIAANPILADLPKLLEGRTLDDHRKVVEARRRTINQELTKIPVRIDEAARSLPADGDEPPPGDVAALRKALGLRQTARQDRLAEGPEAQRRRQRSRLADQLGHRALEIRALHDEALAVLRHAARESQAAYDDQALSLQTVTRSLDAAQAALTQLANQMEAKRSQWRTIRAETFAFTDETVCPACGQGLPDESVATAHEKALAAFNLSQSERLETIQREGAALKQEHEKLAAQVKEWQAQEAPLHAALPALESNAMQARARVEAAQATEPDLAADPDYAELLRQKAQLDAAMEDAAMEDALAALDAEIAGLTAHIAALEASQARAQQTVTIRQRMADLAAEEKTLATEFETLERQLYLMDQFTRTKVDLLETRINQRFRLARIKLFETQVNGALQEVCVTTYRGVAYPDLNHAAQIQVGLDIVRTLSEHYGLTAPIFIDGRESVSELPAMDTQVISLIVSPQDPTLRVDRDSPTHEKAAI